MSSLKGTNNTLQQWLVRKHGKVKSRASNRKDNYKFNNPQVTNKKIDQRIKLRRQQQRKKKTTT